MYKVRFNSLTVVNLYFETVFLLSILYVCTFYTFSYFGQKLINQEDITNHQTVKFWNKILHKINNNRFSYLS